MYLSTPLNSSLSKALEFCSDFRLWDLISLRRIIPAHRWAGLQTTISKRNPSRHCPAPWDTHSRWLWYSCFKHYRQGLGERPWGHPHFHPFTQLFRGQPFCKVRRNHQPGGKGLGRANRSTREGFFSEGFGIYYTTPGLPAPVWDTCWVPCLLPHFKLFSLFPAKSPFLLNFCRKLLNFYLLVVKVVSLFCVCLSVSLSLSLFLSHSLYFLAHF